MNLIVQKAIEYHRNTAVYHQQRAAAANRDTIVCQGLTSTRRNRGTWLMSQHRAADHSQWARDHMTIVNKLETL